MDTFSTRLGKVWRKDCIKFLEIGSYGEPWPKYDLIFADPPFNLGKQYPSGMDDALSDSDYKIWCEDWIGKCIDALNWTASLQGCPIFRLTGTSLIAYTCRRTACLRQKSKTDAGRQACGLHLRTAVRA